MAAGAETIKVVRGESGGATDEILRFLTTTGGLNEEAARRQLSQAVCVALDGGEVVGVSSAHAAGLQPIGGRRFWIYRSVLAVDSEELWSRLFCNSFDALAVEFERSRDDCLGVCALVGDQTLIGRSPEVVWPDTELMLAGFLDDDRQVRIRYFWGEEIGPGLPGSPPIDVTRHETYPLEERYRVQSLAESSEVGPEDVVRFWSREGAVPDEAEASRRVREVQLVATEHEEGVVGVSSLYLQQSPQLRMDMWHYRTYVSRAHRHSNVAAQLIFANRDLAEARFLRGQDTRAPGIVFELENEGLKKVLQQGALAPG